MAYIRANDPKEIARQDFTLEAAQTTTAIVASLLPIKAGSRILDLGCGTGTFTKDLARRFPKCRFRGWDADALLIDAANISAKRSKLRNCSFAVHKFFEAPPLKSSDRFHAVVFRQALMECADPVAVINWARKLLLPGGYIAALEPDYGTTVFHPEFPEWAPFFAKYAAWARGHGEDFFMGRRLFASFTEARLKKIRIHPIAESFYSQDRKRFVTLIESEIVSISTDGERLIREAGVTREEFDAVIARLKSFLSGNVYMQTSMVFALGWR